MEHWAEIRRRVLTGEISKREACRRYEIHWLTLKKILSHEEPPGYRRVAPPRRPTIEPVLPVIRRILDDDAAAPKKQRHTARRRAPAAIERTVRMIAHRAAGARPMVTVAAAAEAYILVLERLTALEGPRPVVIGEVPFSAALRRRHPRAMARVRELQALVRPVAEGRRIDWIDLGEELAGTPDRDLWQTDGVHLSARGNELYAAVLARRLRD
jgi:hypothetical protein